MFVNMILLSLLLSSLLANAVLSAVQVKRSWESSDWNNHCILPPCPKNANYEVTGAIEGWGGETWPTEVVFTCWPGYTLVGSRAIECYDGEWSDQTPQCIDYRTITPNDGFGSAGIGSAEYDRASSPAFPPQHSQQQFISYTQQMLPKPQQPPSIPQEVIQQQQQPISLPPPLTQQQQQPISLPPPLTQQQQQPISLPPPLTQQQQQPISLPPPLTQQQQQPISLPPPLTQQQQQPISLPPPLTQQQQLGNSSCTCDISQLQQLMLEQQRPQLQSQTLRARGVEQLKKTSDSTGGCILPPYPGNGTYKLATVMNPVSSNQRLTANLTYSCNSMYILEGVNSIYCLAGRWSDKEPKCRARGPNDPLEAVNYSIGGRDADLNELPWHVGIYDKGFMPYMQICGGSIISNKFVISAAHCFWDDLEMLRSASQFAVGAGKLYRTWNSSLDGNAQQVDVRDIKVPPRYQHLTASYQEDIALLTVATEFTFDNFVMPVILDFNSDLDSKHLQEGNRGMVGGWGLITEDGERASRLQVVMLPYIGIKKCIAENEPSFRNYITADKICAGYRNGTAVCMGDSGGGLVYTEMDNGNLRYYLRGIVSTAPTNDNACNIYAWTTFTHLLRQDHFIQPLLNA